MPQPLGYYSLDSRSNQLLADMEEQWECDLHLMTDADRLWILSRLCHEAWQAEPSGKPPSSPAEEAVDRLHELSYHEKLWLIQALAQ